MFIKPTLILHNIYELEPEALIAQGIKAILFDLDNTVMLPKKAEYTEDMKLWLEDISKYFKIAILTNNSKPEYIAKVKEVSPFPVYEHAAKPDTKVCLKALRDLDVSPSEVMMVGDRPLTDIGVGIKLGMVTVLVDPLNKMNEAWYVRAIRAIERFTVRGFAPIQYKENLPYQKK